MPKKAAKKILEQVSKVNATKVMDALALPQRILMKRAAEKYGVTPGETSEESAFRIVDEFSKRKGLPEDSAVVNALKASAVAGLETFADPLGPIGKLGKFMKLKRLGTAAKQAAKKAETLKKWGAVPGPRTAPKTTTKTTKELWAEKPGPRPKPTASPVDPQRKIGKSPWEGKKQAMEEAKQARKAEGLSADTSSYNPTLDRERHVVSTILSKKGK